MRTVPIAAALDTQEFCDEMAKRTETITVLISRLIDANPEATEEEVTAAVLRRLR